MAEIRSHTPDSSRQLILEVKDLKKYFPVKGGFFSRTIGFVLAVDGISFTIERGETLGLVGESGCGKTTVGKTVMKLIDPTAGEIFLKSRRSVNETM